MQETACNAGGVGLIPGWGRSPGEGNGNPLHILAWEIPWTEEPDGLQSMELQRVGHNLATKQQLFKGLKCFIYFCIPVLTLLLA